MIEASSPVVPPLDRGKLPPKKVAWLHPGQLIRTAYHVWLSATAAEFLDRRETLAALDREKARPERIANTVPDGAALEPGQEIDALLRKSWADRGLWIDYVADIGDSWEATYAVLKLLVTPSLRVRGTDAPFNPGQLLVLGGDLVYPTPSRERYRTRTRSPLVAARPSVNGSAPCLFAIPGNHDWYDGLTNFVREFCQGQMLGGWSMIQRRSYFAIKLTQRWWLWGIDIALDTTIDLPQQSYFLDVLHPTGKRSADESFMEGDNIILCTAKPAWVDEDDKSDGYRNLTYFIREIIEKHGGRVRVVLAGDVHHYSRYENAVQDQMITAGGGGSYLSGTHQLPYHVHDLCVPAQESGLAGETSGGEPKPENAYRASEFPYPSRSASRRLALGTLLLAFRPANFPFVAFVGGVYWFIAWTLLQADKAVFKKSPSELVQLLFATALTPTATLVFFIVLVILTVSAIVPVASKPSASRWLTIPWGLGHGLLHLMLAMQIASLVDRSAAVDWMAAVLPYENGHVATVFTLAMVLLGGLAGATLVGVYFVLSDMLLGWHTNEVFAAQSITNYRNCLRMHIDATTGTLRIFPIGLRKVPRKWRLRLDRKDGDPFYEPTDCTLDPHLIEGPIEITRRA